MTKDTWNYPCWQTSDWGPDNAEARHQHGAVFEIGPGATGTATQTQPFSDSMTILFSFYQRAGWSDTDGGQDGLFSLGSSGNTHAAMNISLGATGIPYKLSIEVWDQVAGAYRYIILLGDEDGTEWIKPDKWYQCGISFDSTGISWCINGETSPTVTETTNAPGAVNLDNASERLWVHSAVADTITAIFFLEGGWPTVVVGPTIMTSVKMDFSDAAVRNRIWDSNGDFKNPGEDGSLWLGDTYGSNQPEIYLLDGGPRFDNGSENYIWIQQGSGGSGTMPGGLKKQYSAPTESSWAYATLSAAESSGDAWVNGDIIRCGPSYFVYLSDLASSGHSGLIHKDPFAEDSTVASGSVSSEEAAGTDPDTWTGSDISTGTKGVDYEFDTNGGKARFRNITGSGQFGWSSTSAVSITSDITFMIFDAIRVTYTGASEILYLYLRRYEDASNFTESILGIKIETDTTHYSWLEGKPTWSASNVLFGSPIRLWVYLKDGRMTAYSDEKISSLSVSTDPRGPTAQAGAALFIIQAAGLGKGVNVELGYHIAGELTL